MAEIDSIAIRRSVFLYGRLGMVEIKANSIVVRPLREFESGRFISIAAEYNHAVYELAACGQDVTICLLGATLSGTIVEYSTSYSFDDGLSMTVGLYTNKIIRVIDGGVLVVTD